MTNTGIEQAIVTGGASGIGRSVTIALARRGHQVTVVDRCAAEGEAVVAELAALGLAGTFHEGDVSDEDVLRAAVHGACDRGPLAVLVGNAGINLLAPAEQVALGDWRRMLEVNLMGVVNGVAAAYPVMLEQRRGHIINVASMAGLAPSPFQVPYAATKHAVVGLSTSLRAEAARHGVRVSVVCPGWVATAMRASEPVRGLDRELLDAKVPFRSEPARVARDIVSLLDHDRAVLPVGAMARPIALLQRLAPWLVSASAARLALTGTTVAQSSATGAAS